MASLTASPGIRTASQMQARGGPSEVRRRFDADDWPAIEAIGPATFRVVLTSGEVIDAQGDHLLLADSGGLVICSPKGVEIRGWAAGQWTSWEVIG